MAGKGRDDSGLALLWCRSTEKKLNVVGESWTRNPNCEFSAEFELTECCDPEYSCPTVMGHHEINSEFFIISF